jgi:CRP-like cAMP-binding protein
MLDKTLSAQLDQFFQNTQLHFYKKRVMILHPNESHKNVFYIKNGYVRVFRITEDGEELTLTILKPRDFFPLTYGLNKAINSYYLEAITPLELWRAPQEEFIKFITSNPEVLYDLTTKAMVRVDGVFSRMEYLVLSNAYIKVATTLIVCANRFGKPSGDNDVIIEVPLTHRDIATLVGITRETTSLEMKKLEKEGFLGRSGRLLTIKNIKRLEETISLVSQEESSLRYSL